MVVCFVFLGINFEVSYSLLGDKGTQVVLLTNWLSDIRRYRPMSIAIGEVLYSVDEVQKGDAIDQNLIDHATTIQQHQKSAHCWLFLLVPDLNRMKPGEGRYGDLGWFRFDTY